MLLLCFSWRGITFVLRVSVFDFSCTRPEVDFMTGASFSENFYGLKRRRKPLLETERANAVVGPPPEEKLAPRDISRSLFFLVCRRCKRSFALG